MKKNQLTTIKSADLVLGRSKSLLGITTKILENKNKGLVQTESSQKLTLHDDVTIIGNLMWEKETQYDEEEMNWYEAMEYAKNLRLAGHDDWRLPTIEELMEIVTLCGGRTSTPDDFLDSAENLNDYIKKKSAVGNPDVVELHIVQENITRKSYQDNYKALGFKDEYTSGNEGSPIISLNVGYWSSSKVRDEGSFVLILKGSFDFWNLDGFWFSPTAVRCVRSIS